jgi:formiminoglutamase
MHNVAITTTIITNNMPFLIPFTQQQCLKLVTPRKGETKLGQTVFCHNKGTSLVETISLAQKNQVRFVIMGIGEDIGPRANLGRGGATDAFESAMMQWLNLQSNRFLNGKECLILGQVQTNDLQLTERASADALRANVDILDKRVIEISSQVMAAGFELIVIGGGHNNAYGLLMGSIK